MPSFGRSTSLFGGGGGGSIGGSGTAGKLAKFTAGTTLGDSIISDDGTDATVAGRLRFSGTTHGGLVLNNLTTAQRDAIAAPLAGSLIWNTSTGRVNARTASAWTSGWVRLEGDTMTGALGITQGTITAATPALDITATWNNAATVFQGIRYTATNTASNSGSRLVSINLGASELFFVRADGYVRGSSSIEGATGFLTGTSGSIGLDVRSTSGYIQIGSSDTFLYRDAAGAFAQRNGTNAQSFRVYNTYTSATNYERGVFDWQTTANTLRIGTEKGSGGGTARALEFVTDGTTRMTLASTGLVSVSNDLSCGGGCQVGGTSYLNWAARAQMRSPADGIIRLANAANSDFDRLQFGGTTSSFPALKRSSATLECKLADDSAYTGFAAEFLSVTDGMTAPAAVAGRARIYVDTADGDLKVVFGDGTIKTIVTDT